MIKFLKDFITGTFFLFLAGWIFFISFQEKKLNPAHLPDYDFLPEIEQMMAEKRFQESEQLCCSVIGMKLPHADAAGRKLLECRMARKSKGHQVVEGVKGFLTGEGGSSAAVTGAVLSDLCLVGDLRDLGIQAYNKIQNRPVDKVIVAISGVGAFAELLGVAGTLPALVKQIYRAGAFTSRMKETLQNAFRRIAVQRHITPPDRKLLKDLGELTEFHGFNRSRQLFKGINTPEELAAAVKIQKQAPEVPWLLALAVPADCGKLFLRYGEGGVALLKSAVRKGSPGGELLKKIRIVKWSTKNIIKGRFHDMLLYSAIENPAFARLLPFAGGGLLLAACFFYCRGAVTCGLFSRCRQKTRSKAEGGS